MFLFAVLVLADWGQGNPTHTTTVAPSHVATKATTAVALAAAAMALWLLAGTAKSHWRQRFALICALAVAALGAATLTEYLVGQGLGIDQLLGRGSSVEINTTNPGRMAPEAAVDLALLGTALCLMRRPRLALAAQALAVLVAMMGLFNLIGHVYGAVEFYKFDHKSSIGIGTATAFMAMGVGILLAQPEEGLMRSITSELPGGVVIRRLLFAVLFLPLALGWLELEGERAGLFDHTNGTVAAGVAGSVALMVLIWRTAKVMEKKGRERNQAEESLHKANESLEQSVRERTVLLASANQSLDYGITERERMEELLHLRASALESAANAIAITDRAGIIEWVNPAFCALTGYSAAEAIAHNMGDLTNSGQNDAAFFRNLWDTILDGRVWRSEVVNRRKDGSIYTEFQTITPVRNECGVISHFVSIKEDITEKKLFQEQSFRAQRVENLGMLAAGIAHDFNNALAPILMAGPLLRREVSSANGKRMLDIIEQCSERGAALVRQMLSFARGTNGQKMQVQMRHVLREVTDLAENTFPKSIRIESHLSRDLWSVMGDPTKINQVFMNLFINARDAMEQGGVLVVTATNQILNAAEAAAIEDSRPGRFLKVEVRDTGTGIAPDVLKRIWDPFFTTKGDGKGTGLGLSTVRGIVRQHEGFVVIQTAPKGSAVHGTAFSVYLPAVIAEGGAGGEQQSKGAPARRGDGELILVVDDEASVRELCKNILIHQGYRVVTANDGAEAIVAFGRLAADVRLLLTDNDMPVLGGIALIAALRRLSPALPVVIISGDDVQTGEMGRLLATAHLQKPFVAEALMSIVRHTLDEARPSVPCMAEA